MPSIERLTSALRRTLAKGFEPGAEPSCHLSYLTYDAAGACSKQALHGLCRELEPLWRDAIGFVFPTYVSRSTLEDNLSSITSLQTQLESLVRHLSIPVIFFVGMQWDEGQEEEAGRRLQLIAEAVAGTPRVKFVGMTLRRIKKNLTLNAAFAVATQLGLRGVAWVDDDVRLAPDCLRHLVARFLEKGARGSVGARKIPQPRRFAASKVLHRAKQQMKTPLTAYPHGCCMMADAALVAEGIPWRYTCDDDYYCFALLRRASATHSTLMEIVPEAQCFHTVGGPAREVYKRIRRSLFSGHILQADFPPEVARFYFSRIQFYGLWPLAPLDLSRGLSKGLLKWLLKAIYYIWYLEVGAELFFRGLLKRPLRQVAWSAYSEYEVPCVPPDAWDHARTESANSVMS